MDEAVSQREDVRLDGVEDRIEGFRSRFQSNEEMASTRMQWEHLLEVLADLSNRLTSRNSGSLVGGIRVVQSQ